MSMKPIQDVENMQPEAIELFEAAGYMYAQTIFDHKISDITTELIKANNVLEIIDTEPNRAMVVQWLQPLEVQFGGFIDEDASEIDPSMLIDSKDIINTPLAVLVSEKFIDKHHIDLLDLPAGNFRFIDKEQATAFLSETEAASLSYKVISDQTLSDPIDHSENDKTELIDHSAFKGKDSQVLDKSRILKIESFQSEGSHVNPIAKNQDIHFSRTTQKETNEGVDPRSKFYIKGVLHKDVPQFKSGCHWFIFINILIFLSFAITSLVLVDKDYYSWVVWAPLLGLLGIMIYFGTAQRSSCPVCNQKQFVSKKCLKHKNAHHWPVFGYMLPTAIHALLFKWFKCIFCGTSVRLKK
ncbi:MAG: hypothetical protein ACJAR1_001226 [Rubritalea sp.]|jgi:hypothetical protein